MYKSSLKFLIQGNLTILQVSKFHCPTCVAQFQHWNQEWESIESVKLSGGSEHAPAFYRCVDPNIVLRIQLLALTLQMDFNVHYSNPAPGGWAKGVREARFKSKFDSIMQEKIEKRVACSRIKMHCKSLPALKWALPLWCWMRSWYCCQLSL